MLDVAVNSYRAAMHNPPNAVLETGLQQVASPVDVHFSIPPVGDSRLPKRGGEVEHQLTARHGSVDRYGVRDISLNDFNASGKDGGSSNRRTGQHPDPPVIPHERSHQVRSGKASATGDQNDSA